MHMHVCGGARLAQLNLPNEADFNVQSLPGVQETSCFCRLPGTPETGRWSSPWQAAIYSP